MTNTAHRKKLYDDMLGCFTRSNMTTNPMDCFSEGANFAKMFFSSSDFTHFLENQTTKALEDLTSAKQLKELVIKDIENFFQELQVKGKNMPLLLPHITQYQDLKKSCLPNSFELAFEMHKILRKIRISLLFIVKNTGSNDFPHLRDSELYSQCKDILEIIVKLNDKGDVEINFFDQNWQKFQEELAILDRLKHTSIWYSIRILSYVRDLYALRNRELMYHNFVENNHHSAAELFLNDCDQFDMSIDTKKNRFYISPEEFKIHLHRIWIPIKKILTPNNPDIFYYDYNNANDLRKGILSKDGEKYEFINQSAELLYLLIRCRHLSTSEACEELNLSADSIRSARRTIKQHLDKTFGISDYVTSKGIISINYPTQIK